MQSKPSTFSLELYIYSEGTERLLKVFNSTEKYKVNKYCKSMELSLKDLEPKVFSTYTFLKNQHHSSLIQHDIADHEKKWYMPFTSLPFPGHLAYLDSVNDWPLTRIGRDGRLAAGISKVLSTAFTIRGTEGSSCGFSPEFSEVCWLMMDKRLGPLSSCWEHVFCPIHTRLTFHAKQKDKNKNKIRKS